jgi:anionic cell wall polymer biosynthesis LytR-Cps2A-Psr (LCP) family protein
MILKASGLKSAVDTMDGVKVTSPEAFSVGPYNFIAGTNELNGTEALAFASRGTAYAERVTSAVVDKMTSGWAATHYTDAMTALGQMMTTDFSRSELKSLIGKGLSSYTREAYAVTGTQTVAGTSPDASSVSAVQTRLENVLKGQ